MDAIRWHPSGGKRSYLLARCIVKMGFLFQLYANRGHILLWPTTVTSKQNAHIKFKSLTSNSNHSQQIKNHSQQIQIAHSKLQIHHSKLQIIHIKYKSFTSNTNRSQQIQIAHSKYKSLTTNTNMVSVNVDCGLRTADCGPGGKAD